MAQLKNKVGRPRRGNPTVLATDEKLANGQRFRIKILVDLLKVWAANDRGESIASHVPILAHRWGVSTSTVWKYHAYYADLFDRVKSPRVCIKKDASHGAENADVDSINLAYFDSSADDDFLKEALACYNDGVGELCMYFSGVALRKAIGCNARLLRHVIACAITAKRQPYERSAMHARILSLIATQKDHSPPEHALFDDFHFNFIHAYMSEVFDEYAKRPERKGPKTERLLRYEETLKRLSASFKSRFWSDFVQVKMASAVDRGRKLQLKVTAIDNDINRSWFVRRTGAHR